MKRLLYFSEKWCKFCEQMEPVIDQIKNQIPTEKINIEYSPETAREWGVTQIPTTILLENGQEVRRFVGTKTISQLVNFLMEY